MKTKLITLGLALLTSGHLAAGIEDINNGDFAIGQAQPHSSSDDFGRGDWLLGASASYNRFSASGDGEDVDIDLFFLSFDFSYFLNENISLGLASVGILIPSLDEVDDEEFDDTGILFGFEANARYYFPNSSHTTPYLGVQGGSLWGRFGGESESVQSYGLHAGLLTRLNENVYLDTKLKWNEFDLPSSADDVDLSTLQVILGIKVRF